MVGLILCPAEATFLILTAGKQHWDNYLNKLFVLSLSSLSSCGDNVFIQHGWNRTTTQAAVSLFNLTTHSLPETFEEKLNKLSSIQSHKSARKLTGIVRGKIMFYFSLNHVFSFFFKKEKKLFWLERGVKKGTLATNYEGNYSDYSDACSAPSSLPPPPGTEGSFLSPESDVSMVHWKQPPCAVRWMPRLNTMAPIWIPCGCIPDRSPNKRKRATLLSFTHVVILLES